MDKHAEARKLWKKNNRDKVNAYARKARAMETPEEKAERRAYQREYMKLNGYKYKQSREHRFKRKYNITEVDYDVMFKSQGGVCAICFKVETRKTKSGEISPLVVDHNHSTGKVRALLCHNCNSALGQLKEDPNTMLNMFSYVVAYNQKVAA